MQWRIILFLALVGMHAVAQSQPALSADSNSGESVQAARERVARSYENGDRASLPVPLSLRIAPPDPTLDGKPTPSGWGNWSGTSKIAAVAEREIEIVAHMKTGQEAVIDRIKVESENTLRTISDGSGSIVGYFRHWQTKDDIWTSARGAFVMYLLAGNNLIERTGEARCKKIGEEGTPGLNFANAKWDNAAREIEFDIRSNCYHVELFGGRSGSKTFNLVDGNFSYNSSFSKSHGGVDESKRVVVSLDEAGDLGDFGLASESLVARKAFRSCLSATGTTDEVRVCHSVSQARRIVFWQASGKSQEHEFACDEANVSASFSDPKYAMVACDWAYGANDNTHALRLELVASAVAQPIDVLFTCVCKTLRARRLHFDPDQRSVSFNLDSDTDTFGFEGDELKFSTEKNADDAEKTSLGVQVFSVKFNENWQVIQISADAKALEKKASGPEQAQSPSAIISPQPQAPASAQAAEKPAIGTEAPSTGN